MVSFASLIGKLLSFVGVLALTLFLALIWGEEQERKAWAVAASTLDLYTTEQVCTTDHPDPKVLNCGHCGPCSNRQDIRIYHETRASLTSTMTDCARGDFLFGRDAFDCLKEAAGMTDGCTKCWVLNYECNIQNCVKTCVKQRFFPFLPSYTDWQAEPLNNCHACDERLCGPVFVGCAGANRRRVGVVSDIERDHQREICNKVDWDWILAEEEEDVVATKISTENATKDPETSASTATSGEEESNEL